MGLIAHIISFFSSLVEVCHNSDIIMAGRLPYTCTHTHFLLFPSHFIPLLLFFLALIRSFVWLCCTAQHCADMSNRHAAQHHHHYYMHATNMASFNRYIRYTVQGCVRTCMCVRDTTVCLLPCMYAVCCQATVRHIFLFASHLPSLLCRSTVIVRPFRATIIQWPFRMQKPIESITLGSHVCMRENGFLSVK